MIWLGGQVVIGLLGALLWWGSSQSEDAKAGYQGAIMMGQVMSIVICLALSICWGLFWLAGTAIGKLLGIT